MVLGYDAILREVNKNNLIDKKYFDVRRLQPASYDCLLSNTFAIIDNEYHNGYVKLTDEVKYKKFTSDTLILKPGDFILGSTYEWFNLPTNIRAQIDGKSSIGRLGISIHITAGYIDPGFKGFITLEIKNETNDITFEIPAFIPIAQISFSYVKDNSKSYNGKYNFQTDVEGSKYYLNFAKG